jgi:putative ABC transport system ATP-binding protein
VVDEETFERLRHEDETRLDALIGQRLATGAGEDA